MTTPRRHDSTHPTRSAPHTSPHACRATTRACPTWTARSHALNAHLRSPTFASHASRAQWEGRGGRTGMSPARWGTAARTAHAPLATQPPCPIARSCPHDTALPSRAHASHSRGGGAEDRHEPVPLRNFGHTRTMRCDAPIPTHPTPMRRSCTATPCLGNNNHHLLDWLMCPWRANHTAYERQPSTSTCSAFPRSPDASQCWG